MVPEGHELETQRNEGRPGADRPAERGRVPIRAIIAAAIVAARRDLWRILAVAIAVSLVTALLEIIADHVADPTNVPLAVVVPLITEGVSLLGTVFLSGFLCRLVGEAEHGREPATLGQVARSLPWRRLILADILVTIFFVVGLIALVIPGLIVLNLLAVVGPVIEIEDHNVRGSLRRSARLVRPHFWPVAVLATLPVFVLSELEAVTPEPSGIAEIFEFLAARGVAEGVIEALISLVLVQLCYRLIDLDDRKVTA
jgi:hypothetical protein